MSPKPIVLYDLASRPPCKTWSPNPWKTRFALNFKGLEYKTEWTEYPDIKPKLKDLIPPNSEGLYEYTSPTITLPDGTTVMDSRKIATVLEERYPEPSLYLDSSQLARLEQCMPLAAAKIRPIIVPRVPKQLLNDASLNHWYTTREAAVGMTLDEYEKSGGPGAAHAWKEAEPALKQVTALLMETEGRFFMGNQVSYADFMWAGFMIFFKRLGELDALLEAAGEKEAHLNLLEGVSKWAERDDH